MQIKTIYTVVAISLTQTSAREHAIKYCFHSGQMSRHFAGDLHIKDLYFYEQLTHEDLWITESLLQATDFILNLEDAFPSYEFHIAENIQVTFEEGDTEEELKAWAKANGMTLVVVLDKDMRPLREENGYMNKIIQELKQTGLDIVQEMQQDSLCNCEDCVNDRAVQEALDKNLDKVSTLQAGLNLTDVAMPLTQVFNEHKSELLTDELRLITFLKHAPASGTQH